MSKILLVEDDEEIARIVKYYLAQEEIYDVVWAKNSKEALLMSKDKIDLFLLDIMLPDQSGIELCKQLRECHAAPILFISCIDDRETVIQALENGGDDYIIKPFDNHELHARIKANLRRVRIDNQPAIRNELKCDAFTLDATTQTLIKNDKRYPLVQLEYRILSFLMMHPNEYFKAGDLYQYIWGKSSYGDNRTVAVHIHNLRKKCEDDPSNPVYIKNVWGKGYVFDPLGIKVDK